MSEERDLIRAAQNGSKDAFEGLYRRHWRSAYRAAYLVTHDAAASEDIAQEAFLAAARGLGRFDRRRPFAPWLHRIVVNRSIDWTRARAARAEVLAGAPDHEQPGAGADTSGELLTALAALPADQRAVVVLRYLLEYTPGEIAGMLDLPRGTVNSRLRRGLDSLGTRLEAES
jgi:RNA polymerase sigma-70 factor (ECF subfamily)